ncbi:MAG: hypothetical protein R3B67_02890 [Phycisphaerales bacterium]
MDPTKSEMQTELSDRASKIGWVMPLLDEQAQQDVYARIMSLLKSEDAAVWPTMHRAC